MLLAIVLEFIKETPQRELSKRVTKESFQIELREIVSWMIDSKDSSQIDFTKRVRQESFQS